MKFNMDFAVFLQENKYIDFSSPLIAGKAKQLFKHINTDAEKAKIAFEYVRDEIPHSFDIKAKIITSKASDVLKYKTGICHAKANLLAALLRTQGIPTGMCFQHITLAEDDSLGYCVHCYNAIYVNSYWIKVDARGNTNGKNAQFSFNKPLLAFTNRQNYDEFFWPGIYASPHKDTMEMLDNAICLQDVIDNIPDYVNEMPDIVE
jgi:transglutaminase-like putative cysteine protease